MSSADERQNAAPGGDAPLQSLLGNLATGVPAIDMEHAYLIELERRLALALRNRNEGEVTTVFHDLLDYMAEHFMHEERLMDCLSPEAAKRHKEEHANISGRLVQFIGRPGVPARLSIDPHELAAVVAAWLENHIRYWDMPLARIILQRDGPAPA